MHGLDGYTMETVLGLATSKQRTKWRAVLLEESGNQCHWCHQEMRIEPGYMNTVTIEHMIPRCQGGTNHRWNLSAACARCNCARKHTSMDEFELICAGYLPDDRSIEEASKANKIFKRKRKRRATMLASQQAPDIMDRVVSWMQGLTMALPA